MKIITPNDIKKTKINKRRKYQTIEETVSKVTSIDKSRIQFSQGESDGLVLKCQMHPLIEAVHVAYSDHLPLVLSPDAIWYCISNAVAVYINKHSEEMRKTFVDHDGKKRIEVRRDEFVFGRKNPWNEVIDEFSEKIKENTNANIVDRLQADFSTTSKIARVASQIVVMDAMQQYFENYMSSMCGIPEIRITGEKSDWESIKKRANGLVEIIPKFKEWIDQLNEILDHFINVFDDKVDNKFWNEIYKVDGGSGGPYISGWIVCLYPYLKKDHENRYVWNGGSWRDADDMFQGLQTDDFVHQLNQVPFIWNYYGTEYDMLFVGGLVGVSVDKKDSALTPIFGYAVAEDKNSLRQCLYKHMLARIFHKLIK